MRVVEAPLDFQPHVCLATGRDDGKFVDFEVDVSQIDPRLVLRASVVEEAGQLLGMVPQREVQALQDRVAAMDDEIASLKKIAGLVQAVETAEKELQGAAA